MNDGIGGATVLALIVFFVVIFSSYMAFNVNYTKAFRVKNKVIDCFNKYGTACRNVTDKSNKCNKEIEAYAKSIGYSPKKLDNCPNVEMDKDSYPVSTEYYCAISHKKPKSEGDDIVDEGDYYYFTIITMIDIDIPVINNADGLGIDRYLIVSGDTKTIKGKKKYMEDLEKNPETP